MKLDERLADVYSIDIHNEAVMDRTQAIAALQQTGNLLEKTAHNDSVTVILGGAVAAMVVADLPATRVTHDCDVVVSDPTPVGKQSAKPRGRSPRSVVCPLTGSTATAACTPTFCRSVGGSDVRWLASSGRWRCWPLAAVI